MRHPRRRNRGLTALELAFTLPVWLAIVLAIAEFGWLFSRYTALDAAASAGCRAGSLIDPGEDDQRIAAVRARASARMEETLRMLGAGDCEGCRFGVWTDGAPPSRTLVCAVERPFSPLVGLYLDPIALTSVQLARLEWQREAAP